MTKETHLFFIVLPQGEFYQRAEMQEHVRQVLIDKFPACAFFVHDALDKRGQRGDQFQVGTMDEGQSFQAIAKYGIVPAPQEKTDAILAVLDEFDAMLKRRR